MQIKKRINLKIFIPSSLSLLTASLLMASSPIERYVISGVYIASIISLFLLLSLMEKVVEISTSPTAIDYSKFKMSLIFIFKMGIMFFALSIGIHFIGKKIIIPLLNYVFQIFVLGVSFRRSS